MGGRKIIITSDNSIKKGRTISLIVHLGLIGLLAFPFLQVTNTSLDESTQIVMDFSSGSSNEGAPAQLVKKAVEIPKPKPVIAQTAPEIIETKPDPAPATPAEPEPIDLEETSDVENNAEATASGQKGKGDAESGNSTNGNGSGFIEGTGVLTRAVIDRGNQRQFARQNGTVVLKICINRRGNVIHAEWDEELSSIKDTDIARDAIDNVLNYKFERDNNAPRKECGRMTYIINVE